MTDRKGTTDTPHYNNDSYVRLHVTPLDTELLKVIVSSALLPKARNISYHTLETFPEKRYGFLELPNEDAEKLRKKLNGSVLKGVKIRIERARPSSVPAPLGEAAMAKEKKAKKSAEGGLPSADKSKKRKRDAGELSGIVLKDGRKIKRGWTSADEPGEKRSRKDKEKKGKDKEKKKQAKSKYTDHPECLVKTVLPANAAPAGAELSTPKKKKKAKSREVVVHEFEKTTKFPTFLKAAEPAAGLGSPVEFVDGRGWVDENGNVVEAVRTRPPPSGKVLLSGKPEKRTREIDTHEDAASSSAAESTDSEAETPAAAEESSPVSSAAESDASAPSSPSGSDQPQHNPAGSVRSLSITVPPATPNEPKVHPLEALYKRPKESAGATPTAASGAQPFSFFADGNDDVDEEQHADGLADESPGTHLPMTPFTRQDLELRGIRSAAPTPDTAHPDRRFIPWGPESDEEDQDDEEPAGADSTGDQQVAPRMGAAQDGEEDGKPASDFQKWFWENRGDLNRSWKKRRKIAGKEKRYRDNKARMARAI